ncbi:hypothetical protein COCNU_07G015770 [Cocos nucifera]|uniref:DNA-repair protein Xrcc1 N-terminal domain-containing protein n=1 Tax=Cocos nucifera TaxID=13894 RepID=A0A8K0IGD7_COCNU|nr:hypothetical protein COCNU_07G015770 [Cocos nucifera]
MEMELEPRVKPLSFKVKAMSRESPAQKAAHVLDPDLRTHWSTATNTKEWILLELDETCLLSHIRIYNKSVLEWEITAGLRYKVWNYVLISLKDPKYSKLLSLPPQPNLGTMCSVFYVENCCTFSFIISIVVHA